MNIIDIIKKRRSVRTFDGTALRTGDRERIIEYAKLADNPYQLPVEWKLLDGKAQGLSSPVIVGTDLFIAGKMPCRTHAEEAFGYSFEKIVLYAESIGVGTTWIAGTMNRSAFERAIELKSGELMPCVSPLGYPAQKMSLRETVMRNGIKADRRLDFGTLFFDKTFAAPLLPEKAGVIEKALDAVRLAPSAVNKQPWRVVLRENEVDFYEKKNNGFDDGAWDIQKIDLGIALAHFELAARESGLHTRFALKDPGIAAPDDTVYIASFQYE